MRNPPQVSLFPLGITRSETKNLPEEWDTGGNYQLKEEESTRGRGFCREFTAYLRRFRKVKSKWRKILRTVTIPGSEALNLLY
jgi:hypothetical protein